MTKLMRDIDTLKFDPANSRKHDERNIKAIMESLKQHGQRKPIVIYSDMVVAGNGTLEAAKRLGWSEIWVNNDPFPSLEAAKAYALQDNRSAELAAWDDVQLGDTLSELKEAGYDLEGLGWNDGDLKAIMSDKSGTEGLTDPDEVPEVAQNEFGVKRGDIWQLGNHRLMCGDSTLKEDVEKLMNGRKAEMLFTDPPYGVNYEGGHFHSGDVKVVRKREKLKDDDRPEIYKDIAPIVAKFVDGPCYTWFASTKGKCVLEAVEAVEAVGDLHAMIIWHKTNATYAAMNAQYKNRHEPVLYWKPKGSTLRWCGPTNECTVWEIKRDSQNNFHPTQKPVELAERAIGNHEIKTVLDLFLGSGSTLIACEKTGRKCYGMELDEHYCSVIIKRWQDFTGKKAEKISEAV